MQPIELATKKQYPQKSHPAWNRGKKTGLVPMTAFKKGQVPWNKGIKVNRERYPLLGHFKKHTSKTKQKISISNKGKNLGNTYGFKKGQISYKINFTPEIRKKMSDARKGRYTKDYYARMGAISVAKQDGIKESTSIEKKVYQELKDRGFLFETQKLIKDKFVVDAYIPSLNLVIEADGDYWHSLEKNRKRDNTKNAYLKTCGYNMLRLTETEINNGTFRNKLREVLN